MGGINTLWPLSISNQMLAGIALILCTVVRSREAPALRLGTIVPTYGSLYAR